MKCPKCGAENAEGLTFCKVCWTSFRDSSSQPSRQNEHESGHGPLFGVPYVDERRAVQDEADWSYSDRTMPRPLERRASDPERFRAEPEASPSPRSVLAIILGLLSVLLFCLLHLTVPIDLAGFVLGIVELHDINRGTASRAGRSYAAAGAILSGLALVIKIFIFFAIRV